MTQLTPWSARDLTATERRLLEAAKADAIPSALSARMSAALRTPAAIAGSSGHVAHALDRVGGALFSKAGLWGLLSVAAFAGTASWLAQSPGPAEQVPNNVAQAEAAQPTARTAREPTTTLEQYPFLASSSSVHAKPPIARVTTPVAARVAMATRSAERGPSTTVTTVTRPSADLRAEIALLDRARDALTAGAPDRASRALDRYRRRFEHGELAPEAEALQIEVFMKLGAVERAQRRSQSFLSTYPQHPMAERINQLVAGLEPRTQQ